MVFSLTSASDQQRTPILRNRKIQVLALIFFSFWGATLIGTDNISNWLLENALVFIFIIFLLLVRKRFIFSELSYLFIFIFLSLHIFGAMYTYAENPFGHWLKDLTGGDRNNYDRIVHFSFGFLMAYPLRDYFLNYFKFPNWVGWVLPVEITISFSAIYELVEWAVADIFFPEQGADYLGSQGDIWDAQKDMGLASIGALLVMLLGAMISKALRRPHQQFVRG